MPPIPVIYTAANLAAAMKVVYKPGDLTFQSNVKDPAFDNVKIETFLGASYQYPINLSLPTGVALTKDGSRATAASGTMNKWVVADLAKIYRTLTFDYETMARSRDQIGAYIDLKTRELKGALDQYKTALAIAFWRGKAGDLGQLVGSTPAAWTAGTAQTFTLRSPDDAKNFQEMQWIDLHSVRTGVGGVLRSNAPSATVTTSAFQVVGVDLVAGTISIRVPLGGVAPTTTERPNNGSTPGGAGDFIYQKGTRDGFANGLPELIPMDVTNPSDNSVTVLPQLYGVDRVNSPQRLGGYRIPWAGSFLETINETAVVANVNGAIDPYSMYWMSPRNLKNALQEAANLSQAPVIDAGFSAVLGVQVYSVMTSYGLIKVSSAPYIPNDKMYLLDMSAIKILAVDGVLIKLIDEDGLSMQRLSSDDGFEMQYRTMYQMICVTPGRCAVNNVPATV